MLISKTVTGVGQTPVELLAGEELEQPYVVQFEVLNSNAVTVGPDSVDTTGFSVSHFGPVYLRDESLWVRNVDATGTVSVRVFAASAP